MRAQRDQRSRRAIAALALATLLACWGAPLQAQDAEAGPLVLRPTPELAALGARLAREIGRRLGPTIVGGAPPAGILDAVSLYEVALGVEGGQLRIVIPVAPGRTVSTELEPPTDMAPATVRSVALSIESLIELAHDESWLEDSPVETGLADRAESNAPPEDVPAERRRVRIPPIAKPTIYLRALLGFSPVRSRVLLGPGTGLGLCVNAHCAVLEGDLSLLPDVREASDGRRVSYRSVNFSVRVQLRPFDWGDFTPAATFGLITRIGNAILEGTDAAQLVTNLGLRGTLEIAYRFAARFEVVLESGLDLALNRARFIRFGEVVLLEDRFTPWFSTSVRLRPGD